eukprot:3515718-Amphidinium_carterae.1
MSDRHVADLIRIFNMFDGGATFADYPPHKALFKEVLCLAMHVANLKSYEVQHIDLRLTAFIPQDGFKLSQYCNVCLTSSVDCRGSFNCVKGDCVVGTSYRCCDFRFNVSQSLEVRPP